MNDQSERMWDEMFVLFYAVKYITYNVRKYKKRVTKQRSRPL